MLLLSNGAPKITHPFWLLRQSMWSALPRCINPRDRHVVLIGPDPGLATMLEAAMPGLTVQAFASNAIPHEALVRREGIHEVDVLIAIGMEGTGGTGLDSQSIGRRRVLLRPAGDERLNDGHGCEVRYFGGSGTQMCAAVWRWGRRVASAAKPRAELASLPLKAVGTLLLPLIWGLVAIVGVTMNLIGLVMDRTTGGHVSSSPNDKGIRPGESSA